MKDAKNNKVRVRMAPSPTGWATLGTLRTTLYNYLFARHHKGIFILRSEDTDPERSKKEYEDDLIKQLHWAGIDWDEFYRQSDRIKKGVYAKYIKRLLDSGRAFWCQHSKEELEKEKEEQIKKKQAPRHICNHFNKPEIQKRKKGIIRLRPFKEKIVFNDLIKGGVEFDAGLLGNMSIARDEKWPLYNFGVVIDDIESKISHVLRGEEHLPNTPKQIVIYKALGFDYPLFGHFPLILDPKGGKLSKRHGDISVKHYREEGYLPEALVNYVALLGWNPGTEKEIFSIKELVKEFSLERVHKGGAVFDIKRLDWFNGYYIKNTDLDELTKKCLPYLKKISGPETDMQYLKKIVGLERERLKKLSEIGENVEFFFKDKLDYEPELLIWKKMSLADVGKNLKLVEKDLSGQEKFDRGALEKILKPLTTKYGNGEILWPLRVALTGQKASPGPFETMEVLGKERTLDRIKEAERLSASGAGQKC